MEKLKIIGENIKIIREKLGFTQLDIANYLKIDRSTISYYENGERNISLDLLEKIADIFGVELIDLMNENPKSIKINTACAFRTEGITSKDLETIAQFKKIVKNYLKIKYFENDK